MRILYGVVGEGMGHATRSKVVCEHLVARGHEVKIVVSGRAHAMLSKAFPDVVEIKGLTIRYVDNRMDRDGTLARNVLAAPGMLATNVGAYFDTVSQFRPDAGHQRLRLVRVPLRQAPRPAGRLDRQPADRQPLQARQVRQVAASKLDYQLTKAFVRAKLPGCDHYVVTTFFEPPIRKKYEDDTTLVPPILRKEILDAKKRARPGDHVLVYQTSASDTKLLDELAERARAEVRRLRPAHDRAQQGQLHAQGVQRGRLRRRPRVARGRSCATAASRSSARRSTSASRSSACPVQQPVRAGAQRALPRAARLRPRRADGSTPSSCASFSPRRRSTRRASRSTSRTATARSSLSSTACSSGSRRRQSARKRPRDHVKLARRAAVLLEA